MSSHEDLSREIDHSGPSDRSFELVFVGFFLIVGLLPALHKKPIRPWALGIAAIFLIIALVRPTLLHQANILWMKLALLLNKITSPIFTGVLFYLLFTPVGLVARLFGKDPLRLRFETGETYWIERQPPGPPPEDMAHQF